MSLRAFHVVFIVAATLLSLGFGAWCLSQYQAGAGGGLLAASVGSFAGAAALAVYGVWFVRTKLWHQA